MEKVQDLEVHEEAYTTYEPLDELCSRHHPDNPKDHDLGSLIESIQEFGFVRNVMINETDNLLLYGHGTTEALWQMLESGEYQVPKRIKVNEAGMWLVPTDRGIRLSKKRAKAYVIADNRHSELGGWNEPRLVDNLIALAGKDGRGLRGTGFDGDELDTLIRMYRPELIETPDDPGAQIDKAQELQKKWQVERGQIWEIGRHKLMCGDSTNEEDVERLVGGEKATLLFTSPPYADARDYGGADLSIEKITRFFGVFENRVELFAVNLGILRKDHAVIRYWDEYIEAANSFGLILLSWNIWNRENPYSMAQQTAIFPIEHEFVFVFGKEYKELNKTKPNKYAGEMTGLTNRQKDGSLSKPKRKIVGEFRKIGTVFTGQPHSGIDVGHPATFPVTFPETYINACMQSDDIVVDPFLGSGSTMVAAEQSGHACFGIDIEPKYSAITLERMSGMGLEPKLIQ